MNQSIERALYSDKLVDITTTGRKTGQAHRIEIGLHHVGTGLYLTSFPGRKLSWYANLLAQPKFTLHLKQNVQADLQAMAAPIQYESLKRELLSEIVPNITKEYDLDEWVQGSPLLKITID